MRKIRDTFLHFLHDNILSVSINPVRFDTSDPSASLLKIDALNVTFLDYRTSNGSGSSRVSLDVVYSSENEAVDVIETLQEFLSLSFNTPLIDYTDPEAPVVVGGNIYWDIEGIRFMRVASNQYSHYVCILVLRHT